MNIKDKLIESVEQLTKFSHYANNDGQLYESMVDAHFASVIGYVEGLESTIEYLKDDRREVYGREQKLLARVAELEVVIDEAIPSIDQQNPKCFICKKEVSQTELDSNYKMCMKCNDDCPF